MEKNPFADKINTIAGGVISIITYIIHSNWFLFGAFLLMNIFDWITGWYKAYVTKKENSEKGLKGVFKKLCYWIMIMMAFIISRVFIRIGYVIGINLGITELLGWFVLASLFVNEVRSINENLVEAGVYVPTVLTKGLEVSSKIIKDREEKEIVNTEKSD